MSYSLLSSWYFLLILLLLPLCACNRPWLTPESQVSSCLCLSFFSGSTTILSFYFVSAVLFGLLCSPFFYLISYFRSFSQNPCCLFHNLSIFSSLSLLHICLPPHVPWYFYETFTYELQKGCGQSIPEGGGVQALVHMAGSQRGLSPPGKAV